jgi:endonuclease V-like protein UPF0215 family
MRLGWVRVDALDATDTLARWLASPPFGPNVRAVLLDGVTIGGFNLVDLVALHRRCGRPVIALTPKPPDLAAMRRAIARYFPRSRARRYRILRRVPLHRVALGGRPRFAAVAGATLEEAMTLLQRTTPRGAWPEPLRVAALLARAARRRAKGISPR